MHPTRHKLTARRIIPLLLPVALALSGCGTLQSLPWFQKEMMPEPVMPPPEPEVMAQEAPPPEPIPEEPQFEQLPPPAMMSRPQRPRVASARRPQRPAAKEPAKELPPPPAPMTLVGADYAGVLKVLRKPDTMQNSALSVVWTYADPDCTLQLFFYPDIETKTFHLVKYDLKDSDGDKVEESGACMQQFVAMRTDGLQSEGTAERADSDRR